MTTDGAELSSINQATARRYWRDEDPIGQRISLGRRSSGGRLSELWATSGMAASTPTPSRRRYALREDI
jgi:hypothetical protein